MSVMNLKRISFLKHIHCEEMYYVLCNRNIVAANMSVGELLLWFFFKLIPGRKIKIHQFNMFSSLDIQMLNSRNEADAKNCPFF